VILDLTATANRTDALSMVGVAGSGGADWGEFEGIPEANEVLRLRGKESPGFGSEISEPQGCPVTSTRQLM